MSKVMKSIFAIGFLLMMIALVWTGAQQVAAGSAATIQDGIVNWHPQSGSGAVPGATAKFVRTDGGVNVSFQAKELIPGHVYTLWFIVANSPENCAAHPDPCTAKDDILGNTDGVQADVTYVNGIVAGKSGKGTLSGHVAVGELPNAWFGNGFESARDAELHLVVNDHGPKIPNLLGNMLHTYRGGCTDESLPGPFPDTAKSDGTPGPNTCRLYQSAIVQP